jgi:cytochrome c biogenesis protein CcdA
VEFGLATYALSLLAGALSTLSPCVLPIVPILLGSASAASPRGPLALAAGLALSYALVGTAVAWAGANLDADPEVLRAGGAVLLALLGLVLLSSTLQQRFARATAGLGSLGQGLLSRLRLEGVGGQFVIGAVLGVVWSPCVGPTLGAAITLASQGQELPRIALLMGVFGLGAALPVLLLGWASRSAFTRWRGGLVRLGAWGKTALGLVMLLLAVAILTGADKALEAWLVAHSPDWLTHLTTRY